jgi:ABC-type branched-subunit amino acid transport system ATPase component
MPLFRIQDLTHYFGGLCAVSGFNLSLDQGELVGIIGPNGAG